MPPDTEGQTPVAPPPTQAEDPAALKAQLAAAEAEKARLAQEHQLAMGYLQQMTAMVQQQQQPPTQQPPPTDDDDLFVQNPKAFKARIVAEADERARQQIQQVVGPAAQSIAISTLGGHRERASADSSMPHFGKWEKEIYQVLAPGGVDQAMNYGAWKHAYNVVAAQHVDELVEERMQQRASTAQDEYDEEELPAPAASVRPTRIDAPGPLSSGRGGQAQAPRPRAPIRLTPEERVYAQRERMTAEEYVRYRDSDSEDIMGFKGRDRV